MCYYYMAYTLKNWDHEMHPKELKKLDIIFQGSSLIFESSWITEVVLKNWKKCHIHLCKPVRREGTTVCLDFQTRLSESSHHILVSKVGHCSPNGDGGKLDYWAQKLKLSCWWHCRLANRYVSQKSVWDLTRVPNTWNEWRLVWEHGQQPELEEYTDGSPMRFSNKYKVLHFGQKIPHHLYSLENIWQNSKGKPAGMQAMVKQHTIPQTQKPVDWRESLFPFSYNT